MGKRSKRERQEELWIAKRDIVETPGHVFYDRLNELLGRHRFDERVEHLCRRFYQGPYGRPSIAPGVYFRMMLVGYFEGLDSERGIAWRVADSLSLRNFLGYGLDEKTPDHSTISRTRRLYWLSTHQAVFRWGAGCAGSRRPGAGRDGVDRCDDAGGECGAAFDRATGEWAEVRGVSATVGGGGGDRGAHAGAVGAV